MFECLRVTLADCTELYLGGKGIEQLAGFERLTNLEVLWLNDNKLTAITGLNSNMRIKQLYAHVSCTRVLMRHSGFSKFAVMCKTPEPLVADMAAASVLKNAA